MKLIKSLTNSLKKISLLKVAIILLALLMICSLMNIRIMPQTIEGFETNSPEQPEQLEQPEQPEQPDYIRIEENISVHYGEDVSGRDVDYDINNDGTINVDDILTELSNIP